jgi:hypothetical protein
MSVSRLTAAVFCILLLVTARAGADDNQFPVKIQDILENAEEMELYSLAPERAEDKDKTALRGWKVLGKTVLKEAADRKKAFAAVQDGVENVGKSEKCFRPRLGLRAVHDGKTVDLLISYECGWLYIYLNQKEEEVGRLETGSAPELVLDKMLRAAGVPLAKKPDR